VWINPANAEYTDEEQLVYGNLYLKLPWEAGIYRECMQENRDTPTHLSGSVDEYALDFDFILGEPVITASYGMIYTYYEEDTVASAYGNHAKVDHAFFYTLYAHLDSFADKWKDCQKGCEIGRGEVIGYAGNTGVSISGNGDGSHLHWGLYDGYAWEDGYSYSVPSRIEIGSPNLWVGPYQVMDSIKFKYKSYYLSSNFYGNERGVIVCSDEKKPAKRKCKVVEGGKGKGGYFSNNVTIKSLKSRPDNKSKYQKSLDLTID